MLSLVSSGLTNQQIADRLFLSPRTVEMPGTANRTELAALALTSAAGRARDGFLGPDLPT